VLKPGGVLVATTPDNSLLWTLIWAIWSRTVGRMWHHERHVAYTAEQWRALLEKKFEVTHMLRNWRFDLIFRCIPREADPV
jgi:hypothetical protein